MSIGFLLPQEDSAIIWRGPKKNGLIRQFLTDVSWNELDVLVIDTPPGKLYIQNALVVACTYAISVDQMLIKLWSGTSDEHLSVVTYLNPESIDGAVVVTTPQQVALCDVRKEINFW